MTNKHQPCGKPGCINCWPKMPSDPAMAPMQNPLSDYEKNLRDAIIRSNQQMQNIAPGSPLYDRLMGANLHTPPSERTEEARSNVNREHAMIRFILRAIGYWLLVSATMLFVHFVASTI